MGLDPSAAKVTSVVDGNGSLSNSRGGNGADGLGSVAKVAEARDMVSNDGLLMMEAMEAMLSVNFFKSGCSLWPRPR
jgi:hypothetical protein